jgi:DNA ligase D-like protein (predicted ligase)
MLAQTGKPFNSGNYLFEPKWDGLRTLLFLDHDKIEFQNRNLRDITHAYPELQAIKSHISAERAIIDGEIVVLNYKGIPDFGRLQNRFGIVENKKIKLLSETYPATFAAFDLIHLNNKDLLKTPLRERKQELQDILLDGPYIFRTEHVEKTGIQYYEEAHKLKLEGTIGKENSSPYFRGTRSGLWVKIKHTQTMDCIVVGYTAGEGRRRASFGSLVLAMYDKSGQLVHAGNVGGGFSDRELDKIKSMLDQLTVESKVLEKPIEPYQPVTWVKPMIVVQVEYAMVTIDKRLRFPRYHRLRPDKKPEECRWE